MDVADEGELLDTLTVKVYLDHNSTTPVDPRVMDAMLPYFGEHYGNPSSSHALGSAAARAIAIARRQVAELVRAEESAIVFCSAATEAINTIIASHALTRFPIVTVITEHSATLKAIDRAEQAGCEVKRLSVDSRGLVDLIVLEKNLRPGVLVSLLWANNETGVIHPVDRISEICERAEAVLHVDGVQAAGKIHIDLSSLAIDFLTLSSHKICGPKGIAAFVATGRHACPLIVGGGQESGQRGGTENVPGIVGFGLAAQLASAEISERRSKTQCLRDTFEQELLKIAPNARINAVSGPRLSNTCSVSFPGIDGEDLVLRLNSKDVYISTGSACESRTTEPSHVIRAMTGSRNAASEAVRFSFSHTNTIAEVAYALDALAMSLTESGDA